MRTCKNPACAYGQTGICVNAVRLGPSGMCPDLGAIPGEEEEDGTEAADAGGDEAAEEKPAAGPALWSGAALGLDSAREEGWHPDRRLFLVAGAENAGKTCLLVATWVSLANRTPPVPWRFAGSWTLLGWQQLASKAFEWPGGGIRVLPHTTMADTRSAGFLHLELSRDRGDTRTSVLITDFPGEWFDRWVVDADAPIDRLDGFGRPTGLYFCLDLPRVRSEPDYVEWSILLAALIERTWPDVPIAITLTKCDQVGPTPPNPSVGWPDRVQRRLDKVLCTFGLPRPSRQVFATAAFHAPLSEGVPAGVVEPLLWLLDQARTPAPDAPVTLPAARPEETDYFAAMEVTRERD